ncbi:TetR/AcrR family transcriptional regulator [uncultured Amnibacterium sp.]|uniref:TetR/AcrR family transcriptional regulator n=1 Tax=uncultured Amnibacterium sp. TaxID=1631851 RepID=UPI0035C9F473
MTAPELALRAATPDLDATRMDVLRAAIRCFRQQAFNEVTLQGVAAAAGLELRAVQALHPTLNDLVIVTVRAWNAERTGPLLPVAEQAGAVAFLRAMLTANLADPALMRLLTAMVDLAATPGHPLAPALQRQWGQFHAHVQRTLTHDVGIGRESPSMEPADAAEQLIAIYEGLQLQSMLRPTMDVVASFDRAVTRFRDGWAHDETPHVWDI